MSMTTITTPNDHAETEERTNGVWSYISASRLNTWLSCPLKFRLRYLDGIRSPTSPALFLGKQVHAGYVQFAVM